MEEDRDMETLVGERESEKVEGQDEAQEGSVAIRKGGVMVTDHIVIAPFLKERWRRREFEMKVTDLRTQL